MMTLILGALIAIPCQQLTSQYILQELFRAKPRVSNMIACAFGLLVHLIFGDTSSLGFALSMSAPFVACLSQPFVTWVERTFRHRRRPLPRADANLRVTIYNSNTTPMEIRMEAVGYVVGRTPNVSQIKLETQRSAPSPILVTTEARCPVCRALLLDGTALVFCQSCFLPHHEECAAGHKCAAYGCGAVIKPVVPRFRIGQWARVSRQSLVLVGAVYSTCEDHGHCPIYTATSDLGREEFCEAMLEPAIPRKGEWWRRTKIDQHCPPSVGPIKWGWLNGAHHCSCVWEPVNFGRGEGTDL